MKLLIGPSTNPYFNLAMEEYFLKEKQDDWFMLWQNEKSVIIGKNQNAYAEINQSFVTENNIKVVRRITGGGAVFHDLGNVNYTFIKRNSKDFFNDYSYFSKPIIKYLNSLGVNAHMSGRNDLLIETQKFSGNAQCAYKDSVMHHGTMLFSSSISDISDALNVNELKIKSKGIASVRSRVTNISEHLDSNMNVEEFICGLKDYVLQNLSNIEIYQLNDSDINAINDIVSKKYSNNSWNYGFKPEFTIKNEKKYSFGLVEVNMCIQENIITSIRLFGDFFGIKDIVELENIINGSKFSKDELHKTISDISLDLYIRGMNENDLIDLMFMV